MRSIFTQRKRNPTSRKSGASRGQIMYAEDERDAHSQYSSIYLRFHTSINDKWSQIFYWLQPIVQVGVGGFVSASMDVDATCTHPRGLSAVNTSRHAAAHSGGRPVWLFPQSPWKKRACPWQEECARPPQKPPSYPPQPQTSTHWTHQVISWGLKYLLGKYLPWLSDPTSQFKDMGLTNFSLYLTNHQDIPRPHPGHRARIL